MESTERNKGIWCKTNKSTDFLPEQEDVQFENHLLANASNQDQPANSSQFIQKGDKGP